MKSVIIAYPIKETAIQIRNVLESEGMHVSHICATGASVLSIASDMRGGVIVCANILRDISAGELADRLSAGFDIVSLTNGGRESYMGNFVSLPLPLDREDFVLTVRSLASTDSSFTLRDVDESILISNAKRKLMAHRGMTETQAHKRLQELSMRESKKIADIAKDIIEQYD